jgi:ABC-type nitrate/sulfonate/bicarbonate transport system ATPase subunit
LANLIAYREVRKVYNSGGDEVIALDNFSLDVADGEFVTVVGRSGCGKTTLLKLTSGLLGATSGSIHVAGEPVTAPLTNIGIVFQAPVLLPWRKTLDNVLLQIEARKLDVNGYRKRALELLELTGLKGFEDRYPAELSGGMQQRVSISRALIHNPPLLLMDEPFGALDAMTRYVLHDELERLWRDRGLSVVFVTHNVREAARLADRIVVLSSRPGTVTATVEVDIARPRRIESPEVSDLAAHATDLLRREVRRHAVVAR